jgi:hypothetical protein
MKANDPNRRPFDRERFVRELYEDDAELPFGEAADITKRFERCVDRAEKTMGGAMTPEGRSARLRQLLDSEFHLK